MKNTSLAITAMALSTVIPCQFAHATDVFWSGGTDGSWNTGANWGGTAPANNITSDIAVFNGTTDYANQPTLDAFTVQSVNGLLIGGTSAVAFTLSNLTGTQTTNGAVSSGSNDIVLSDVTGLVVGQQVTGSRISKATFITAISGNTITLSQPTAGGTLNTGSTLTFASSLKLGAGGITLAGDTPNVSNLITAPIVLAANQDWNNNAARELTIQGSIFLDSYTLTLKGVANSNIKFNDSLKAQSISGSGGIVIDTDGTVTFASGSSRMQNSFTGGVTLNKGRITMDGGNSGGTENAGALGTGVLTINGGSIGGSGNIAGHALSISGQVWNADWLFTGGKSVDMGTGQITLGTTAGTSRTLDVSVGGNVLTLGGAIVNGTTANSLIKAGTSRVVLTGASTYTGSTTIQAGTIQISGADDRLPTGTTLTIDGGASAGGTFDLNGLNQTVAGLSGGSGTESGVVTNTAAASTGTITVTGTSTFDGVIRDGGVDALTALTKSTAGIFTLGGANTYTGATTVSGGTLALGAANRIADTSNLVLAGGNFSTGGFSETLGSLEVSFKSVIDLGTGTSALVFADSSSVTWGGSISLSFVNFTEGVDSIRFGSDNNALSLAQLSQITINGSMAGIDSAGYLTLTTIPESSSYALVAGFGTLLLTALRRRQRDAASV